MRKIQRYNYGVSLLIISIVILGPNGFSESQGIEVHELRSHTHPTFTRIVAELGQLREYNYDELTSPDRIYVDIHQAILNPILHAKVESVNNGYVNQIRIAQKNPQTVRIAVDLDLKKIKRYEVFHLFDPFRLVIDIYPIIQKESVSEEVRTEPAQPTRSGYSMARQLGLGIRRIVLDPGHGGRDPGCLGRTGSREKNIVLDVTARVKRLLAENTEFEIILTRESDIHVPLENRTVIANQKKADLFISIHANSNPRRQHSGVQTFFLNFSTDPSVMETAARENATSTKNISEMNSIIQKIARNTKVEESRALAEKVQAQLVGYIKKTIPNVRNLGVKGGPFWVLIGGDMPSILVEISHLSNPEEEARLKTENYRQKVAQGIYNGIIEYVTSLGKG